MRIRLETWSMACAAFVACVMGFNSFAAGAETNHAPTMAEIIKQSKVSDWHALDPANTLYLDLAAGRVVIELAPAFAPNHVANIKKLAHEGYFDGLAILRVQDNYVVQWGDPDADDKAHRKPITVPTLRSVLAKPLVSQ